MEAQKSKNSVYFFIGSMLFGMFFGAGNLIFPVQLGQQAGANTILATLGFLITATGLPFLGVVAMGIVGSNNLLSFSSRVHPKFGYMMTVLLYLTIGPFFALPRTATVSFEVGLAPVLSKAYIKPALAIFTVLFFVVALAFSLRPARILDWIGKILNPLFLLFIAILFIIAIVTPMGDFSSIQPQNNYVQKAFPTGLIDGYQTMDALAALAFGGIVIAQIKQFGFNSNKSVALGTVKSGLVSVLLMCVIYSGLAWLGATSVGIFTPSANGGAALAQISRHYFGDFGSIFLTLTITIACLKTAIGLITSCSQAFTEMFPRSLSYKQYCVLFTIFSCLVANIGLNQIIALATPVLMLLYPLAAALIFLSLLEPLIGYHQPLYIGAVIGALCVSVIDALATTPAFISNTRFVQVIVNFCKSYVPLFQYNLGWLLPALVGAAIGLAVSLMHKKRSRAL